MWPERGVPIEPAAIQTPVGRGNPDALGAVATGDGGKGEIRIQPPDIRGVIGGDDSTILDPPTPTHRRPHPDPGLSHVQPSSRRRR